MHSHTSRDNLPLVLNARTVAEILGVSLAVAYRFWQLLIAFLIVRIFPQSGSVCEENL